jgi:recombination protein RecA
MRRGEKRTKKKPAEETVAVATLEVDQTALTERYNKAKAIILKSYGKEAINSLSGDAQPLDCISTGFTALDDLVTGSVRGKDTVKGSGRGIPKGRIIEIFGPESSGKTTLALTLVKAIQDAGGSAGFVDVEHAFDPAYAQALGVDTDEPRFLLAQPNSAEEALSITSTLARGGIDIIVLDSVAALVPEAELVEDDPKFLPGRQAALMSQHLRKVATLASKSGAIIVYVNQLRMKIGVMFGNPETTSGGNSLKFYASIRFDVRRRDQLKDGKPPAVVGIKSRVKTVKNKVAPPFRELLVNIVYGLGIKKAYFAKAKKKEAIKLRKDSAEDDS